MDLFYSVSHRSCID